MSISNGMKTDWDNVASWYDKHLEGSDTYQAQVIAPNLLRMLDIKKGEAVLDLACGQAEVDPRIGRLSVRGEAPFDPHSSCPVLLLPAALRRSVP